MTPIEKLYQDAKSRKDEGAKVMSIDYVIQMLEQEASTRLIEAQDRLVRQSV